VDPWDVIVVGAGVSGLSLARLLHDDGFQVLVLDKSHRTGGRLSTKNVGGFHLDPGPKRMISQDTEVQELLTRWLGTRWIDSHDRPGSQIWHFANSGRDIAEHWSYGLRVQRNHITHLVDDGAGNLGVVRHGFGEPVWGRNVVLTAPIPQSQAMIAYSDFALDYALDEVSYHRRQVLLASMEGDGIEPDSNWSTDIIESIRLRPHHEGLLGIEAMAREAWSEATWDDDSTISHGRLLLELGLLIERARIMDTQVMRWRYAVTDNPHPQPYWRHQEVPGLWMAGDGFGANSEREYSMERAVQSASAVYQQLKRNRVSDERGSE